MKIDCGPTYEERIDRLKNWHCWYAWKPVRLGSHDCRWFERIERKGEYHDCMFDGYWTWEYRELSLDSVV